METATLARPGPKTLGTSTPLDLSDLPRRDHRRVYAFAKQYLTVPKGKGATQPFLLRSWQRELCRGLYPARGPRPTQGLLSIPRGNGKSTLAAVLALYSLYADDVVGPQVLTVAKDLRQASIIFDACRRMVEKSPELRARTRILKDRLEVPYSGGVLMPLPADAGALQGWDPSACIVDELHVVNRDIWEAMVLATGKRDRSLCLAISTPGTERDSIMWDLVLQGRAGADPDFYFKEYTSDPTHPTDCEHCWVQANPALGDFLTRQGMASARKTSREARYRLYRLGQWIEVAEDQWITPQQVEETTDKRPIPDGAEVVLAFDGSFSMDATAIVAATVSRRPHIDKVAVWEPKGEHYRIPVADVENTIRQACKRWRVRSIDCDPYRWTKSLQELRAERLPVFEFPQTPTRMTPATTGLYEAICNGEVTHSGDPDLTRHLLNARVMEDSRGTRLQKDRENSARKIDLAVCAVMAHSRARELATKKKGRVRSW